ncbi:peptidase S8/S53 domain-containing protein [Cokeromyces recurvatus]|uniref:peptidase S8/S53 domain-containing protein n=1 Tax=Cokeromyces recurvatus TaxID=90255 RepID=UPI002220BE68|nr:peptidase S8/S53 domain-containing protein [Cokeromyces recurvatus]KAI7908050.1 peptidase S8/S53 domain-containing protein [Cokeromyces recurvatus]
MKIVSLITFTSFVLLPSIVFAIKLDDFNSENDELLLTNPKYKWNSLGKIIPGRFIIEFNDNYHGSSFEFITNVESDISQNESIPDSRIKMSIAQDFNSSSSIFRGVSINIHESVPSHSFTKRDSGEKSYIQSYQNVVLGKLIEQYQVKYIYPVIEIPRPKVNIVSNDIYAYSFDENHNIIPNPPQINLPKDGPSLPFTHVMTQVDKVHSKYRGEGILVGIIDSGVDYYHPALGGGFGPGYPIQYGYDLVGDDFDNTNISSRKQNETPLDTCIDGPGHGTHVTGIIAANDRLYNFTGVAPEATLGVWRVFGCNGGTSNDLVIKALINAYETGCDIINLSLGSSSNWADTPMSLVANRISDEGVIVIAAAGNDGQEGAFYISSPGTGLSTLTTASVNNDYILQRLLILENRKQYPYSLSSTTKEFPSGQLISYSNKERDGDACIGTNPDNSLKGKIVLVQRGGCTFEEKVLQIEKYEAIGILIYNNQSSDTLLNSRVLSSKMPLAFTTLKAGKEMRKLLNKDLIHARDGIFVKFKSAFDIRRHSSARKMSPFSSIGPLYSIDLKPDLAAPGDSIFSTLPIANGGYGILSGTSMAAPYVAGACALFLQAHGRKYDLKFLKEHLQNYVKPIVTLKNYLDNPSYQGSGMLQLLDAINQSTHVSPGSLSFNDTDHIGPRILNITNLNNVTITYRVENKQSLAISPYNTTLQGYAPLRSIQYTPNHVVADIAFSKNQITLGPGESIEIELEITSIGNGLPDSPYPIYGGFIQFSPIEDNSDIKPIHVPYIGIQGSMAKLPIFDEGFPHILNTSTPPTSLEDGEMSVIIDRSFDSSPMIIIIRLLTGTSQLVTDILDANMTKIGYYKEYRYLPRNTLSDTDPIFIQRWNGTMIPIAKDNLGEEIILPPGRYFLNWKALKLLSDPSNLTSWESRLSPPILIRA